jgi:hypothetical protein
MYILRDVAKSAPEVVIDKIISRLMDYRSSIGVDTELEEHEKPEVDYEKLYAILRQQPLTYDIIKGVTGLKNNAVVEVITTLSLRYPLYSPGKGVYELLR